MKKIQSRTNWKELSQEELIKMQNLLDKKPSMTIGECGIWLQMSISQVHKLIKKGQIVAYHPFGGTATRIDTEATKKNLKQVI